MEATETPFKVFDSLLVYVITVIEYECLNVTCNICKTLELNTLNKTHIRMEDRGSTCLSFIDIIILSLVFNPYKRSYIRVVHPYCHSHVLEPKGSYNMRVMQQHWCPTHYESESE